MPGLTNIVFDSNYTGLVPQGGYPTFTITPPASKKLTGKGFFSMFDDIFASIFPSTAPKTGATSPEKSKAEALPENNLIKDKALKEQVRFLLETPDADYSDKLLTSKLRQYILEVEKQYNSVINDYKSHIAPSFWEHKPNSFNISGLLGKTYYAQSYPSYIDALRTRDLLSFHAKWDMSWFIYPEDDSAIQSMLKTRATQLKSEIKDAMAKGVTLDTEVEQQYKDVEMIREKLTTREERYFESGYYINIFEETEEKLKEEGKKFEQKIS